ncbi:MAG TPA: chemotaxis protein CheX [Opitutaceae bacterium]|jgi:chemotaxis protein CheX|nr:chemotaxis protein CheX [Opitutaceae bacterium]
MHERDLDVFIQHTMNYFTKIAHEAPEPRPPTIDFSAPVFLDFTGAIDVSGQSSGTVYLTMPDRMARALLEVVGEPGRDEATCRDLVGEIASTISSNARAHFGSAFQIAVPRTFTASTAIEPLPLQGRFILPLRWRDAEALLVISITELPSSNHAQTDH